MTSLILSVIALAGCEPPPSTAANSAPPVGAAAATSPTKHKATSLGMNGYNYTDLPIATYTVSEAGWGGDVSVSSETSGGGGTTCCGIVPTLMPHKYLVRWSRDRHRWCELEVWFNGPIPDEPRFFNTHFFEDGHVEITISHEFTDLLMTLPNYKSGLSRKPSGNVVMDDRLARCKDAT